MKSILITGAYGQLGESCSHHLKNNYKLILSGITPLNNGIKLDITDQQSVNNFLEKNNPDVIINGKSTSCLIICNTTISFSLIPSLPQCEQVNSSAEKLGYCSQSIIF